MAVDYHRAAGCKWDGKTPTANSNWFSLLDWAVYHADGHGEWQAFRKDLVGSPIEQRASKAQGWLSKHGSDLANTVRVLNLMRSLRGQWSSNPSLPELAKKMNARLAQLKAGQ